jgi:solute carrier family 25 iron transporter 28/37
MGSESLICGPANEKLVDTIRTLQQTSTNFSYVLPFARYWRGLGASVALTTPAFTVYMVSYRQCKRDLTPYLGESAFSNYVISGAVAELTSSVIWTPMEVVKGRMQILEAQNRNTMWLIGDIYRKEGIKGFFRGYWMGVGVFLPHSVVWWTSYEVTKGYVGKDSVDGNLSAFQYGLSSAAASTTAATCSNFLDVVKTRQQLAVAEEISKIRPDDQQSVLKVARNLVKEVGLFRALFKGLHIRLMHSLPSSILAMIIVEKVNPDIKQKPVDEEIRKLEHTDYY